MLLCGVAGIIYAFLKKPEYESRLTFALDSGGQTSSLSGAMGLASQLGINIGGGTSMFEEDNIIEIILSRRIIERVLLSESSFERKNYKLIEYYLMKTGLRDKAGAKSPLKDVYFQSGQDKQHMSYQQNAALKEIYELFNKSLIKVLRPDKKLNVYQVSVKTDDEVFTKVFTERLMQATDSFYKEVCTKKSANTLKVLEERAEEAKKNLHGSIDKKSQNIDANLNPAFAESMAPIVKKQFDIELYGGAYVELFKNLEIARYQYLKDVPLLQIIDQAEYPMDKVRLKKSVAGIVGGMIGFIIFSGILLMLLIWKRIFNSSK